MKREEHRDVTKLLPIDPLHPESASLDRAAEVLRQGRILAYPTETLYGLGVDPFREESLEGLYRLKGRPAGSPLSVLVRDLAMLQDLVEEVSPSAGQLINSFLPGPLTVVLPARSHLPPRLTGGTGKIGIRISSHPLLTHLFERYPFPITTTSANPSGRPNARDGSQVLAYFPEGIDCILDAGTVTGGIGSTVVDVSEERPRILREGAIAAEQIGKALA